MTRDTGEQGLGGPFSDARPSVGWSHIPELGTIIPDMGTREASSPPPAPTALADVLFTPVQQRVLGLLFGQPERRFQSAELIRLAGAGTGAVHRLLTRLAATGLLRVETVGNQKFYQANERAPVYAELVGLVRKTVGLAGPLQAALAPLAQRITAAFVYGSVARGGDRATSDIDLMVIADDLDYAALVAALAPAEAQLARPINPNLMTRAEWRRKRAEADSFAARIAAQPKVFVIGAEDDLG
jgi:predicted nucleotidyltransferase